MSQENVEIVRRCLDAWSHGDIAAMTALNHPDIEADWSASHSWFAGVYHGNDACMAVVEEFFEVFETLVIDAESYVPAGDAVVVPNIAYLRGREGVQVTARSTFVFTLHERKITKIHLYEEPAEALKAVGMEE